MTAPLDEHVLAAALDEAADFVILNDDSPTSAGGPFIVYANRSYYEATGFSDADIVGKPYTAFFSTHNPPQLLAKIKRSIEAGGSNSHEVLARRKDDTDFWVEFVGKRFHRGESTRYRLVIARDITLRRRSLAQVALLFAATEQSSDAIALYEPCADGLQLTYENEEAFRRGSARLPELWKSGLSEAVRIREALEGGREVREFFAELDASATPSLVEFHARGIRSDHGLEAIVTLERAITAAERANGQSYASRLLGTAAQLTSLARATSDAERVAMLRAILLDAFGAEVARMMTPPPPSVHLDPAGRIAIFTLGGTSYAARWDRPLETTSLTALRFCIEAAIEQEAVPKRGA